MSGYIKISDIPFRDLAEGHNTDIKVLVAFASDIANLPTIEVSEDNKVLYGTDHNCILTMFGECSYNETGCSDCAVAEKIRKALSVEVSEDCISRQQAIEALIGWQTEPLDEDIVRTLENLPPVTPTVSEDNDYCNNCPYINYELVHCSDCKFKRLHDGETKYYYCALEDRPNRNWSVDDWDFCSWAERRE